jgi:hypothetical protein
MPNVTGRHLELIPFEPAPPFTGGGESLSGTGVTPGELATPPDEHATNRPSWGRAFSRGHTVLLRVWRAAGAANRAV